MFLPSLYWVTLIKLDHAHISTLVFWGLQRKFENIGFPFKL